MTTNELRLNCDAIDVTPQAIDWSQALGENMDGWRSYECQDCQECGRSVVISSLGECEHKDIEPMIPVAQDDGGPDYGETDNECNGTIRNEGPMMNYFYPVKLAGIGRNVSDYCEEAARKIAHLPLCVVEFEDGRTALALTGGGMDLSWEICEAFIALGYFPPLHFCDLPRMSDRGKSDKDKATIAACQESCRIAEGWAARKRKRLAENFLTDAA